VKSYFRPVKMQTLIGGENCHFITYLIERGDMSTTLNTTDKDCNSNFQYVW